MNINYLNIKFILFVCSILLLTSCGESDECAASNWSGSWGGTITCLDLDIDFTITISEQDANTVLIDFGSDMRTVAINNCSVNVQLDRTISGNDFDMDLTLSLNGTLLDASLILMAFGNEEMCDGMFSRR